MTVYDLRIRLLIVALSVPRRSSLEDWLNLADTISIPVGFTSIYVIFNIDDVDILRIYFLSKD